MSLKASKENQIFDRREDVTASEETARAKAYVKNIKMTLTDIWSLDCV